MSLFQEACKYIPGGVNSPVRAFHSVGGEPIFFARAKGSRVWSADGAMDAQGRQAVVEMLKGRFTVLCRSNHFTQDRIVEFDHMDPDRATGLVLAHAGMQRNGQPILAAIRYQDVYQRCEGRWRFRERGLSFIYDVPTLQCHYGKST